MKFIVSFICLIMLPALVKSMREVIALIPSHNNFIYLCTGFVAGILLFQVFIKNHYGIRTFLHESAHAVMAVLFFRKIERFVSTPYQGGYVKHSGGFGDDMGDLIILLAPYFFPLLAFFSLVIRFTVPDEFIRWSILLTGLCVSTDLQQSISEIKRNWNNEVFVLAGTNEYSHTDIARTGFVSSTIIIGSLSVFLYTMILYVTLNGLTGIPSLANAIYHTTINFIFDSSTWLIQFIQIFFCFIADLSAAVFQKVFNI